MKFFKWFKTETRRNYIDRITNEADETILTCRDICEDGVLGTMKEQMRILNELKASLEDPTGKDEETRIRELWRVNQVDHQIEMFQTALAAVEEMLRSLPLRPPPPEEYEIQIFNDFNRPDDE